MCPLPDARRDEPMLPLRSRWVCTSLLEPVPLVPRLPPDGSADFSDPDGDEPAPLVCDHACGAMTSTAPVNTRLDKTVECVFFMSVFLSFM